MLPGSLGRHDLFFLLDRVENVRSFSFELLEMLSYDLPTRYGGHFTLFQDFIAYFDVTRILKFQLDVFVDLILRVVTTTDLTFHHN